ncbi:unnamed protein product [Amoebophrya sp. A120]|nr:unnamed protein product [Amoebophrya sp. A120]|eukprot:GSA120T00002806001.1
MQCHEKVNMLTMSSPSERDREHHDHAEVDGPLVPSAEDNTSAALHASVGENPVDDESNSSWRSIGEIWAAVLHALNPKNCFQKEPDLPNATAATSDLTSPLIVNCRQPAPTQEPVPVPSSAKLQFDEPAAVGQVQAAQKKQDSHAQTEKSLPHDDVVEGSDKQALHNTIAAQSLVSAQVPSIASKTDSASGCDKIGNESSSSSSTLADALTSPSGVNKTQSRRDRTEAIIEKLKKNYHETKLANRILLPGASTTKDELLAFWKNVFDEATSAAREIENLYKDAEERWKALSEERRADLQRQEEFDYTTPVTTDVETNSTACTTASEKDEEAEKIKSSINDRLLTERAAFRRQLVVFLTTEVTQGPWTIEMRTADGRELGTLFDHGDGQHKFLQSDPLAPKPKTKLTCRSVFLPSSREVRFSLGLDYADRHTETVEETIARVAERDAARLAQRLAKELQKALLLPTSVVQPVSLCSFSGVFGTPDVFRRFDGADFSSGLFSLRLPEGLFALRLGTAESTLMKCELEMEETNKVSGDATIYKAHSQCFPVVVVGTREGDRSAIRVQLDWHRGVLQPEPSSHLGPAEAQYEFEWNRLILGNVGTACVFTQDDITRTGNQIELRIPDSNSTFGPAEHNCNSDLVDYLNELAAALPFKRRFSSLRFTFPTAAWAENFLDLLPVKNAETVRGDGIGMDASSSTISECLRTLVEEQLSGLIKDCIENRLPPHPWVYAHAQSPGYLLFETDTAAGMSPQILWCGQNRGFYEWRLLLAAILVARNKHATSVRDHDSNNSTPSNNNRENSSSSPHTSEHSAGSSPTKSDRSGRDGTEEEDKTIRLTLYANNPEEEEEE